MTEISSAAGKNTKKLSVVFVLTAAYMIVEATGGLLTDSLALLADAAHMLTDAGSLGLALLAVRFARRPATKEKTYGYYRAEILAAFINALVLLFISGYILYEAWQRFQNPPQVMTLPMLIIAAIGLPVNLAGIWLLGDGSRESLNLKGAYLEVLSDAVSSIGVIAAGIIMIATGWYLVDPVISVGISLFILPRTWTLMKQAVHILMEGTPAHINLKSVEEAIKQVRGVNDVHDLHVWTITSGVDAMSAHITVEDLTQGGRILAELKYTLRDNFEIEHTTIQLEEQCCEAKGMQI